MAVMINGKRFLNVKVETVFLKPKKRTGKKN